MRGMMSAVALNLFASAGLALMSVQPDVVPTIAQVERSLADEPAAEPVPVAPDVPEPVTPDPVPKPPSDDVTVPLSSRVIGPGHVIIGELVHLQLQESNPAVVRERQWTFNPPVGTVLYNESKTQVYFTAVEPGLYTVDVVSVHRTYGLARAQAIVMLEDRAEMIRQLEALDAEKERLRREREDVEAARAAPQSSGMADVPPATPADLIRRWAMDINASQAELREVGSALARAASGAERGMLSPLLVLSEGRAMAGLALRRFPNGAQRWQPFFDHLQDDLWPQFEKDGIFQQPAARAAALRSVSEVLLGRQ